MEESFNGTERPEAVLNIGKVAAESDWRLEPPSNNFQNPCQ